ncbi:MAG TPA: outer membrane beta-barrel protein [Verrucomicrobiae bacterium]
MRKSIRAIGLFGVCSAAVLASALPARSQNTGFYFRADVGAAWTEDVKVREFAGNTSAGKMRFDSGFRFDAAGGYYLKEWLAGEVETGVMGNQIRRAGDSSLGNVPLLANVVVECPHLTQVVPFIGAGAGVSFAVLDADHLSDGVNTVDGTDTDAVFAYQGFAGLRYKIDERWDVSLAYRYFGTSRPSWDVKGPGDIRLDRVDTHAVVLGFTLRF